MSWLTSVWGEKPKVIAPKYTNLSDEQKKALEANISSFPKSAQLGDLYSQYLQGGIEKQLPGFAALGPSAIKTTQTLEDQAGQLARGEIPQDVQDLIRRTDAYQSLMGGTAGSPMSKALVARDFGRTSLDLINQGAQLNAAAGNSAQQWDRIASGTLYDPSRTFISPAQQEAITAKNNELRQSFLQTKANVAAAPTPFAKGVSDTLIGLIGAYLGAGRGGGSGLTQPTNPYSGTTGSYGFGNMGDIGYGSMPNYGVGEAIGAAYQTPGNVAPGYQPVNFGGY